MKTNNEMKRGWQNLGAGKNTYLRINKKGQFEILGHLSSQKDISKLCKELYDCLTYEWQVMEEKKKVNQSIKQNSNEHLFPGVKVKNTHLHLEYKTNTFSQIKELHPVSISDETG